MKTENDEELSEVELLKIALNSAKQQLNQAVYELDRARDERNMADERYHKLLKLAKAAGLKIDTGF